MNDHVARAETTIQASPEVVWRTLTTSGSNPEIMFGSEIVSDWTVGSAIVWRGEWQGKTFEDKGIILSVEPFHTLSHSHFSPMTGLPDQPENYHTVTYTVSSHDDGTRVVVEQDNNPTSEAALETSKNWEIMLAGLRTVSERSAQQHGS
jgi:uncharacterized protein YndB with AHSA1/START domain